MTRWSSMFKATKDAPIRNRSNGPRNPSMRSTLTSAEKGTPPKLNRTVPRVPDSKAVDASSSTPAKLISISLTGTGKDRTEIWVSVIADRATRRLSVMGRSLMASLSCKEVAKNSESCQLLRGRKSTSNTTKVCNCAVFQRSCATSRLQAHASWNLINTVAILLRRFGSGRTHVQEALNGLSEQHRRRNEFQSNEEAIRCG